MKSSNLSKKNINFAAEMISDEVKNSFFKLLRAALCGEPCDTAAGCDWQQMYLMSQRQTMIGVVYSVVEKLPKDQQPPLQIAMQWMRFAEAIRGMNQLHYDEAARLTKLFGDMGRSTAILKGQANARLYPDKSTRQPGDIDIWVEGGRDSVLALLDEAGFDISGELATSYHHVHLPANERGVVVEVHFRPSSGNLNPITNRRLQRWLEHEIQYSELTAEGFSVPSMRFALMMQLSHIQRHFLDGGIGLRQICDYLMLLQNCSEDDRNAVAGLLKKFGLRRTAGALMWVLAEVLHLEPELMLCKPDAYRGEWMLREIMDGGNFGWYNQRQQHELFRRALEGRLRNFRLMRFDFCEIAWHELSFWASFVRTLPLRIKYRTLSLNKVMRR